MLMLFNNVKRIWINVDSKELSDAVESRDKIVNNLESAEAKYIQNTAKSRAQGHKEENRDVEHGSHNDLSYNSKHRPTKRVKFFSKKVDTISWSSEELAKLNQEIRMLQERSRTQQVTQ